VQKIEAIIRPEKLEAVKNALEKLDCSRGMTLTEVKGHGRQKGLTQRWRGQEYRVEFLAKVKLEMVVPDTDVEKVMDTVTEHAYTGEIGDGKIFVVPVGNAMRIRTKEKGESAL